MMVSTIIWPIIIRVFDISGGNLIIFIILAVILMIILCVITVIIIVTLLIITIITSLIYYNDYSAYLVNNYGFDGNGNNNS